MWSGSIAFQRRNLPWAKWAFSFDRHIVPQRASKLFDLPTSFPWGNQKFRAQVVPKRTRIFGPTGHSLPKRKKEKGGYPDHCLPSPEGQHTPIELGHVYAASLLKMWNSSAISLTDCSLKAQAGCWTPSPGFRIQRVWAGTWKWMFLISFLVTLMLLIQGPSVRTTDLKDKFFDSCEV